MMVMRAGAAKYSFSLENCVWLAQILSEQYSDSLNVQTVKWPNCINQWFQTRSRVAVKKVLRLNGFGLFKVK